MPRISNRQQALKEVRQKIYLNILMHSSTDEVDDSESEHSSSDFKLSDSDSDADLFSSTDSEAGGDFMEPEGHPDDLLELDAVMDSSRYHVERPIVSKSRDFITNYFDQLPPLIFRQMTRMDKASFFVLVALIESHPIFHNVSTFDQAPVEWQLAVTLDRLGHEGNGACLNRLIPTWGVSTGSLCNFTNRCFVAMEAALKDHLRWPERAERRAISQEFAKKGFPGCVGLIDGTIMPISQRPHESGECYYDRKCRYSINTQVVCDHRRKILMLYTGKPPKKLNKFILGFTWFF